MVGNILEWCSDKYQASYYASSPQYNPLSLIQDYPKQDLDIRIPRGGSWSSIDPVIQFRFGEPLPTSSSSHGFRCVIDTNKQGKTSLNPATKIWNGKYDQDSRQVLDSSDTSITKLNISVDPINIVASTNSNTEITIALFDLDENLVKGEIVNLTASRGKIITPAVDNGDGTYTTKYTAVNQSGEITITAVTNAGQFASTSFTRVRLRA